MKSKRRSNVGASLSCKGASLLRKRTLGTVTGMIALAFVACTPSSSPNSKPEADDPKQSVESHSQELSTEEATTLVLSDMKTLGFYMCYSVSVDSAVWAIADPQGRHLLRWRVRLLEALGYKDLYRRFHLDEPWDSPHNIKLLPEMPDVFRPKHAKGVKAGLTFYQLVTGPRAIFDLQPEFNRMRRPAFDPAYVPQALGFSSITDGFQNTLLLVEAGAAVPWTKPEDFDVQPGRPLPPVGGEGFPGFFVVGFADGVVGTMDRALSEKRLRALCTANMAEPIFREALRGREQLTLKEFKKHELKDWHP